MCPALVLRLGGRVARVVARVPGTAGLCKPHQKSRGMPSPHPHSRSLAEATLLSSVIQVPVFSKAAFASGLSHVDQRGITVSQACNKENFLRLIPKKAIEMAQNINTTENIHEQLRVLVRVGTFVIAHVFSGVVVWLASRNCFSSTPVDTVQMPFLFLTACHVYLHHRK